MDTLHIGYLSPEYPNVDKPEGGLGNYIRKTALELVNRGHRVTVFTLSALAGWQEDVGIELRFVPQVRLHWRFKLNPSIAPWVELYELWLSARRLRTAVIAYHQSFPLDIVQTSNYRIPGYALCHNKLFPVVCRCSSYSPMLRSANGIRRKLPEAVADWMEARLVSEADAAFSPSQFLANIYERFEAIKLPVIRTQLEPPKIGHSEPLKGVCLDRWKYLLYFGTLNGIKGVDVLIQTTPKILALQTDISVVFIGPNHILPDGTKAVDKLHSVLGQDIEAGRVIYFQSLPKTQLYPIIENAFGVILPSRVDNLPNACLEAMSLGVPVIGTRHSSLDEMIEDGVTGFLAENGDSDSLQVAISNLLKQTDQQRIAMIRSIRQAVSAIRDEDRIGILLQFYKDVIADFSTR